MFGYEKTNVYCKAKDFNQIIRQLMGKVKIDYPTQNQLIRSSLSVLLNIAEGTGRFTDKDQKHFMVMARSSLFETMAILELLYDSSEIEKDTYKKYYKDGESLSRMLYTMIRQLDGKIKN